MKRRLISALVFASLQYALGGSLHAEDPYLRQKDLFISGIDNVNLYRIPALLVTPSGTLLAFCEAREGDDGDPTDLVLKRSLYNGGVKRLKLNGVERLVGYGENWEPMRTLYAGGDKGVMNPCPVVDRSDGAIIMCCYVITGGLAANLKNPYGGRVWILTSNDDGISWSEPSDITDDVGGFVAGPGVGIQLTSGRLVIPGYVKDHSCVIYSDDHAKTWQIGATVDGKTNESQVVELSDGRLLLNMRSNRGKQSRYVALSRDGGETWFEQFDETAQPESRCQASLLVLGKRVDDRGGLLLFANPAGLPGRPARTHLIVRSSADEGKTWPGAREIFSGPAAYSSLALLEDGSIGLLYETGAEHPYEKITFARFNRQWLAERDE